MDRRNGCLASNRGRHHLWHAMHRTAVRPDYGSPTGSNLGALHHILQPLRTRSYRLVASTPYRVHRRTVRAKRLCDPDRMCGHPGGNDTQTRRCPVPGCRRTSAYTPAPHRRLVGWSDPAEPTHHRSSAAGGLPGSGRGRGRGGGGPAVRSSEKGPRLSTPGGVEEHPFIAACCGERSLHLGTYLR